MADEAKAKGNAAYSAGKFTESINHFTNAINLDPTNHVFYLNRYLAYASLNQYLEALSDAKKTVHLKPDWSNEYFLLGLAHHGLKQYVEAVNYFTDAINLEPTNHVFYFNRSSAYASLNQYSEALSDAKKTVLLKSDWSHAYWGLAVAHHGLKQFDEAVLAYKKGLEVDPGNETLKSRLKDAESAKLGSGRTRMGNVFGVAFGSDMLAKLTADPATRIYMQQPDFVNMMKDLQQYPSNLNLYRQDQRVMKALSVLLNVKMSKRPGGNDADDDVEMPDKQSSYPPKKRKRPANEAETVKRKKIEAQVEPEPEPMDEEERELKEKKVNAQKEKEKGNAAYKKKYLKTAIKCYTKAVELDNGDISFLTNRAAVYLWMGKFDECIKDCEKAVERGRELRSDSKMVAMALARKGTALVKMAKTSKDYEPAIETFQKALIEHRSPDTLKKLNDAERAKKELEQQEYYDHKLAEKEHKKGVNNFYMPICREIDLMESTKSLNTIALKHNELLLAHTSDIKRFNKKITAECKELYEDFKQKYIQLEAENKLLQQREDELKKTEVELKNRERKIVKGKSKLEFNKRARELLSSCKQLDNDSSRKEDEDRKRELCALHKRKMELEDQVKVQNESLQRAHMELETALQVSEDEDGMDLEEKLENLQSELKKKREQLQDWKNSVKDLSSTFNVKDNELQDAQLELIDGMKANHHCACIGVKTLDVEKGPGHMVQQLWHNKEKREASVIECIEYIMKKWKAEQKQTIN